MNVPGGLDAVGRLPPGRAIVGCVSNPERGREIVFFLREESRKIKAMAGQRIGYCFNLIIRRIPRFPDFVP
jgi:hypothetical protein